MIRVQQSLPARAANRDPIVGDRPLGQPSSAGKIVSDPANLNDHLAYTQARLVAGDPDIAELIRTAEDKRAVLGILRSNQDWSDANDGTDIHDGLSDTLLNGTLPHRPEVSAILDLFDREGIEPVMSEVFMRCTEGPWAGTADLVLKWQGRVHIGDLKGLAVTEPIPTPTGWTTMGEVGVGEQVIGGDGVPCTVTAKSATKYLPTYRVKFDNGDEIVCDSEHIWWAWDGKESARARYGQRDAEPRAVTIQEIRKTLTHNDQHHWSVPMVPPVELPAQDLPIDPYLYGCWLGDGTVKAGIITKGEDLFKILEADGHSLGPAQRKSGTDCVSRTVHGLVTLLKAEDLLGHRHIPTKYLRGSVDQRLALLRGLMDTDGTWNKARNRAVFCSTDKAMAEQVRELVLSLGYRPQFSEVQTHGFGKWVTAYSVEFAATSFNPFRLPRKAEQVATKERQFRVSGRKVIVSVTEMPTVATACIAVDSPDRTYLCGDSWTVTHNTIGAGRTYQTEKYAGASWAAQMAIYSRSVLWCREQGDLPWEGFGLTAPDRSRGLVIEVVRGEATARVVHADLELGWEIAQMSLAVLNLRKKFPEAAWEPSRARTLSSPVGGG